MLLLVVQVVVSLSSGGRGGFVLIAASAVILLFLRMRKGGSSGGMKFLFTMLLLVAVAFLAVQFMPENIRNAVNIGSQRTFSYLTKNGIDMSETSNRDDVYGAALQAIGDSPVIGYGLLMKGTYIEGSWPHNIFLEVMLQGGIIYMMFFLIVAFSWLTKLRLMINRGHGSYIIPVALYPFVMLLFSGSYISTGLFWFSLAYVFCYDIPRKQIRG